MDKTVVQQFLKFFQDFITLCQLENWPAHNTTEEEIKNAFVICQHIEKCLDRLQKNSLLDNFLSVVNEKDDKPNIYIKNCLTNPSKCIMRKLIDSKTRMTQMDKGFKSFLELYSEERLEQCLAELMVEAASANTLIQNLVEMTPDKLMILKSHLLLSEIVSEGSKEAVLEMLTNGDEGSIELLVVSLLNKDAAYQKAVKIIKEVFTSVMSTKSKSNQKFWKHLFDVESKYLLEMCTEHTDLYKMAAKALIDCHKLVKEDISAELFYINLNYTDIVIAVQKLCKKDVLKDDFLSLVFESGSDVKFWDNML